MTSYIFTKSIVDQIVERFDNLKCSYEFDKMYDTHYLEIEPKFEFNENETLNLFLDSIYFDFISKYPSESIAFSTNVGKTELSNVCYEKVGLNFNDFKPASWVLTKIDSKLVTNEDDYFLEDVYAFAA